MNSPVPEHSTNTESDPNTEHPASSPVPEVASVHVSPEFPTEQDNLTPDTGKVELSGLPETGSEPPLEEESAEPAPESVEQPTRRSEPIEKARSTKAPPKVPPKKEHFYLITGVSALRSVSVTFAMAVVVATIFMWWTSPDFLSAKTRRDLAPVLATAERVVSQPTTLPTPIWFNRIGVVAGHSGFTMQNGGQRNQPDPGAVCDDGFSEASVTMKVALRVKAILEGKGFTVDLLEEFDPREENYKSAVFISLHADSCQVVDDGFNHSGFKNAYPVNRLTVRALDLQLDQCLRDNYAALTKLEYKPSEITINMTEYHAFHHISPTTPATILELGNLHYDRDLLQNHVDVAAQGIVNGLLCYLDPTGAMVKDSTSPTRALVPSPTALSGSQPTGPQLTEQVSAGQAKTLSAPLPTPLPTATP